jgi:hypothetical protein
VEKRNKVLYVNTPKEERQGITEKLQRNAPGAEVVFAKNTTDIQRILTSTGASISAVIIKNLKPEHSNFAQKIAESAKLQGIQNFAYENYSERSMSESDFRQKSGQTKKILGEKFKDISPTVRIADNRDMEHKRFTLNDLQESEFLRGLGINVRTKIEKVLSNNDASKFKKSRNRSRSKTSPNMQPTTKATADYNPEEDFIINDDIGMFQ